MAMITVGEQPVQLRWLVSRSPQMPIFPQRDVARSDATGPVAYGNITAGYDPATGILSLTSAGATATLAQWQAALDSVTYNNTSHNPTTTDRTITFVANDGTLDSNIGTKTVSVTAVNTLPVATITPTTYSATEQTSLTSRTRAWR